MLYRKVLCSDRLPDTSGKYQTEFGVRMFVRTLKRWKHGNMYSTQPKYWIEPVTIPTNEEIRNMSYKELSPPEFGVASKIYWQSGFIKAIELLTGEK